ncbi:hypothetical protein Tco_0746185 [Tanacetum coccineum]
MVDVCRAESFPGISYGVRRVQREMRQIRHFRFYDRMRIARLEACEIEMEEMEIEEMEIEGMEMEEMEMVMGTEVEMAITLEDLCLLESGTPIKPTRIEAAYAMSWAKLMKLMTEVYCPRNEIQKIETELWNLTVKGNDLTAYDQEEFLGIDNIQGNVIVAEPTKLQDAIHVANNLMDQKAERDSYKSLKQEKVDNKLSRQSWNMNQFQAAKCHTTRDCTAIVTSNTQRAPVGNRLTQKYIHKGCQVYLAQVTSKKTEDKSKEKRLEDVPIIREFPEVFPEDLPRLPPARQVEFLIEFSPPGDSHQYNVDP